MIQPIIIQNKDIWNESAYKTQYFRNMIQNTDYVLCSVSASEYLGLYSGTLEQEIYVFTKTDCIKYHIDFTENHNLLYTTVNQTINDLLADDTMDEQVILESLANLFYKNNYADLSIAPENQQVFQHFKAHAEKYYSYE